MYGYLSSAGAQELYNPGSSGIDKDLWKQEPDYAAAISALYGQGGRNATPYDNAVKDQQKSWWEALLYGAGSSIKSTPHTLLNFMPEMAGTAAGWLGASKPTQETIKSIGRGGMYLTPIGQAAALSDKALQYGADKIGFDKGAEQAQKDSPLAYGTGYLAGEVGQMVATMGMGAGASATKTATGMAKVMPSMLRGAMLGTWMGTKNEFADVESGKIDLQTAQGAGEFFTRRGMDAGFGALGGAIPAGNTFKGVLGNIAANTGVNLGQSYASGAVTNAINPNSKYAQAEANFAQDLPMAVLPALLGGGLDLMGGKGRVDAPDAQAGAGSFRENMGIRSENQVADMVKARMDEAAAGNPAADVVALSQADPQIEQAKLLPEGNGKEVRYLADQIQRWIQEPQDADLQAQRAYQIAQHTGIDSYNNYEDLSYNAAQVASSRRALPEAQPKPILVGEDGVAMTPDQADAVRQEQWNAERGTNLTPEQLDELRPRTPQEAVPEEPGIIPDAEFTPAMSAEEAARVDAPAVVETPQAVVEDVLPIVQADVPQVAEQSIQPIQEPTILLDETRNTDNANEEPAVGAEMQPRQEGQAQLFDGIESTDALGNEETPVLTEPAADVPTPAELPAQAQGIDAMERMPLDNPEELAEKFSDILIRLKEGIPERNHAKNRKTFDDGLTTLMRGDEFPVSNANSRMVKAFTEMAAIDDPDITTPKQLRELVRSEGEIELGGIIFRKKGAGYTAQLAPELRTEMLPQLETWRSDPQPMIEQAGGLAVEDVDGLNLSTIDASGEADAVPVGFDDTIDMFEGGDGESSPLVVADEKYLRAKRDVARRMEGGSTAGANAAIRSVFQRRRGGVREQVEYLAEKGISTPEELSSFVEGYANGDILSSEFEEVMQGLSSIKGASDVVDVESAVNYKKQIESKYTVVDAIRLKLMALSSEGGIANVEGAVKDAPVPTVEDAPVPAIDVTQYSPDNADAIAGMIQMAASKVSGSLETSSWYKGKRREFLSMVEDVAQRKEAGKAFDAAVEREREMMKPVKAPHATMASMLANDYGGWLFAALGLATPEDESDNDELIPGIGLTKGDMKSVFRVLGGAYILHSWGGRVLPKNIRDGIVVKGAGLMSDTRDKVLMKRKSPIAMRLAAKLSGMSEKEYTDAYRNSENIGWNGNPSSVLASNLSPEWNKVEQGVRLKVQMTGDIMNKLKDFTKTVTRKAMQYLGERAIEIDRDLTDIWNTYTKTEDGKLDFERGKRALEIANDGIKDKYFGGNEELFLKWKELDGIYQRGRELDIRRQSRMLLGTEDFESHSMARKQELETLYKVLQKQTVYYESVKDLPADNAERTSVVGSIMETRTLIERAKDAINTAEDLQRMWDTTELRHYMNRDVTPGSRSIDITFNDDQRIFRKFGSEREREDFMKRNNIAGLVEKGEIKQVFIDRMRSSEYIAMKESAVKAINSMLTGETNATLADGSVRREMLDGFVLNIAEAYKAAGLDDDADELFAMMAKARKGLDESAAGGSYTRGDLYKLINKLERPQSADPMKFRKNVQGYAPDPTSKTYAKDVMHFVAGGLERMVNDYRSGVERYDHMEFANDRLATMKMQGFEGTREFKFWRNFTDGFTRDTKTEFEGRLAAAADIINTFTYFKTLGFNPKAALINLPLNSIYMGVELTRRKGSAILGLPKMVKALMATEAPQMEIAMKGGNFVLNGEIAKGGELAAIHKWYSDHDAYGAGVTSAAREMLPGTIKNVEWAAKLSDAGFALGALADRTTRRTAMLLGAEMHLQTNPGDIIGAIQAGKEVADMTHGKFEHYMQGAVERKLRNSPLGSSAFVLMSAPLRTTSYLGGVLGSVIDSHPNSAVRRNITALSVFALASMMYGGIKNIPALGDAWKVFDMAGQMEEAFSGDSDPTVTKENFDEKLERLFIQKYGNGTKENAEQLSNLYRSIRSGFTSRLGTWTGLGEKFNRSFDQDNTLANFATSAVVGTVVDFPKLIGDIVANPKDPASMLKVLRYTNASLGRFGYGMAQMANGYPMDGNLNALRQNETYGIGEFIGDVAFGRQEQDVKAYQKQKSGGGWISSESEAQDFWRKIESSPVEIKTGSLKGGVFTKPDAANNFRLLLLNNYDDYDVTIEQDKQAVTEFLKSNPAAMKYLYNGGLGEAGRSGTDKMIQGIAKSIDAYYTARAIQDTFRDVGAPVPAMKEYHQAWQIDGTTISPAAVDYLIRKLRDRGVK